MTNYIFVYGTLKRGGWNNDVLAGCEYVGTGTARGCVLIDLGACPGMVPGRAQEEGVHDAVGEVYRVPDSMHLESLVHQLDRLENVGRMYIRVTMTIRLDSGCPVDCITYLYMPTLGGANAVQCGEWDQHRAAAITRARHGPSCTGG